MTLEHAMFFLVILMRDRYDQQAVKFGVDLKSTTCTWPENETDDEMNVDEEAVDEEARDEVAVDEEIGQRGVGR
jgi:hypothetical protein